MYCKSRNIPIQIYIYTVCPRSSDPLYVVTYYIKRVTTSWTYSTYILHKCTKLYLSNFLRAMIPLSIFFLFFFTSPAAAASSLLTDFTFFLVTVSPVFFTSFTFLFLTLDFFFSFVFSVRSCAAGTFELLI